MNLLPTSNTIAFYSVPSQLDDSTSVTALTAFATVSLVGEGIDTTGHITSFIYCQDVDTVAASSCQGKLSFWKKNSLYSTSSSSQGKLTGPGESLLMGDEISSLSSTILDIENRFKFDENHVQALLQASNAVKLDQRYSISCPNGWSETVTDQSTRLHPNDLAISPTRSGSGTSQATRVFSRHANCIRDSYDQIGPDVIISDDNFYSSFDLAFTHALHISHIVASFSFDPADISIEDCKIYLLRQKDSWGSIKFAGLRYQKQQSSSKLLHSLQQSFDFDSYETLCGPLLVSDFVMRNEQPGSPNGPSQTLKALVMLTSPELIGSLSRSLTVLVEYSSGSMALAASIQQQLCQSILADVGPSTSQPPPPSNIGQPSILATLSITPMYFPKYKQQMTTEINLNNFLGQWHVQEKFFEYLLDVLVKKSPEESLSKGYNGLTLLNWLFCVEQNETRAQNFPKLVEKILDSFSDILKSVFVRLSSRELATVFVEIALAVFEKGDKEVQERMASKAFDAVFSEGLSRQINSPILLHLFMKLTCVLTENQTTSESEYQNGQIVASLASLSEVLSRQNNLERVPLVQGDSLTTNWQIFDFPPPSHLLDTVARPSYASVVAGLFGPEQAKGAATSSDPWFGFPPSFTNHPLFPQSQGQHTKALQKETESQHKGGSSSSKADVLYACGPRHIFGLIEYECLHFRFHKFCQGARAGSARNGFKVAPPPSVRLPGSGSAMAGASSGASSAIAAGMGHNWQNQSHPVFSSGTNTFPTLSEVEQMKSLQNPNKLEVSPIINIETTSSFPSVRIYFNR